MSESLRILMVSDVSPSVVLGGAERFVWEEARHLAERGHRVRVVSRTPAEAAPGDIQTIAGVSIHHFGAARRTDHAFVRTSILGAQRAVAAALAREPADVLHLHQPLSGFGVLVSAAGRRLPSLYTFHSPAPLEYRSRLGMTGFHRGGVRGHLGSVLLRAVEGACVRRATRVHVLSEFSARLLVSLYGVSHDRIVRIAGGVDTSRFRPARDRRATKAALGVDPRRTLLFTVRNLEARMGLDDLVRAMDHLRRTHPEVLLLIGGTGSRRDELLALIAELRLEPHVRLLGFIPDPDLARYYQAADAFVLPTRELEGFGLVTVEALAAGTPVLGTPVGATPEILESLDPSLLFADTTPAAMAVGLEQFCQRHADKVAARALREACRRHAEAQYDWRRSVGALAATLGSLAAGAGWPTSEAGALTAEAAEAPCTVCGAVGPSLVVYLGRRYRRCRRCGSAALAPLPTDAALQQHYDGEYLAHYPPEQVTSARATMLAAVIARLGRFGSGGRLLDVGCGGGQLLVAAALHGWRTVGTDLSHAACLVTRKSAPAVQAHSAALPIRDGCAEAVTLVNVLDHVRDPLTVLRDVHRVLVPDGRVMIRIPNGRFHQAAARVAGHRLGRWAGSPVLHLWSFTAAGLTALAERAGFRVLHVGNAVLAGDGTSGGRMTEMLVRVAAAGARLLSGGRWRLGPSLELYAEKRVARA